MGIPVAILWQPHPYLGRRHPTPLRIPLVTSTFLTKGASTPTLRTFWKPPLTSQNAHPTEPPPSKLCLALTTDLYRTYTAERRRTDLGCWWWRIEFPSYWILSATTFSPSFPMQLIRLSNLQFLVCVRSRPGFGIRTTHISRNLSGM